MHTLQKRIFDIAGTRNLFPLTLREIGEKIGESHPQKIKHHLEQLYKKGFLQKDKKKKVIFRIDKNEQKRSFHLIPVLGAANCGQALSVAEENIEGYLQVSMSVVQNYKKGEMFALKAVGDSMNQANINGEGLKDGDFAIIDGTRRDKDSLNGKYVLSIIDGMANIKKLRIDNQNKRLLLLSESTRDYPPIIIDQRDFQSYLINGVVVKVIKKF